MIKIFVVILNWNGISDTIECLDSLTKILIPSNYDLTVSVVDNGSTDGSVKDLENLSTNKFKLVIQYQKENLGYVGGNNIGIRNSLNYGANYVVVLNNDTVVEKDFLIYLVESAESKKNVGVVCPKIYFAKGFEFHKDRYKKDDLGKVIWAAGGKIDWNNIYGKNIGVDEVDHGRFDASTEVDFAPGTCLLLKREFLEKTGLFNEKYYLYMEDVDLCIRGINMGWKIIYQPKSIIWHKVARSSSIGSELNDYYISRNRMLFGLKYASLRAKFALVRESLKLLIGGRSWQKIGIKDFYLGNFGKGSWK
ncbi:glycosyltransferase family 2 protein [Candidatus Woesebacteria bacterium]|nr:glycosyltransferase family 2 protein [Candidatus Woesebacteria bacterium]